MAKVNQPEMTLVPYTGKKQGEQEVINVSMSLDMFSHQYQLYMHLWCVFLGRIGTWKFDAKFSSPVLYLHYAHS